MNIQLIKNTPTIVDNNNNRQTLSIYLASNGVIPPKIFKHQRDIRDGNGKTVQDYLIDNNIDMPKQWKINNKLDQKVQKLFNQFCRKYEIDKETIINNPNWQNNNDKNTFAMYLAQNNIIPSKQFIHDPNIKGGQIYNFVRQYLQNNHLPIPNEWYDNEYKQQHDYKPNYINNSFYRIITEKPENINPEQQYENKWTVAMIYAYQGIIPPKEWNHKPELQNDKKYTVAMLLVKNNVLVPKQWCHNPELQSDIWDDDRTVAMIYAQNKIIPPKEWEHKPDLQDFWGNTVAIYLAENGIIPPKEWQYNPELKDNNNNTVALNLAKQGIIPPQQWHHNPYIADQNEKTVQDYLIENNINIPEQWKVIDKQIQMTDEIQQKLKQYCKENHIQNQQIIINYPKYQKYGNDTFASYLEINDIQIPEQFLYDPEYRLQNNMTTSMMIANEGKIPSKYWYHKSEIQDNYGFTVAMYLANERVISPQEWNHDPTIQDKWGNTVAILLAANKILDIPRQWNHDPLLKNNYQNTVAMIYADNGIVPPKEWIHDKNIKNKHGFTVQDYLQSNNIEIPYEWQTIDCGVEDKKILKHLNDFCRRYDIDKQIIINNPRWQDNENQYTFAIYLAYNEIIPPTQFNHDHLLKDKYGNTVAIYLFQDGIIPPQQWIHDINLKNKSGESIRSNMYKFNYYYINNEFIKLNKDTIQQCIQNEILNDTCQICLEEGQQYFIKSTCNHKICLQCFKEMIKINKYKSCPVCLQNQWFILIDQIQ